MADKPRKRRKLLDSATEVQHLMRKSILMRDLHPEMFGEPTPDESKSDTVSLSEQQPVMEPAKAEQQPVTEPAKAEHPPAEKQSASKGGRPRYNWTQLDPLLRAHIAAGGSRKQAALVAKVLELCEQNSWTAPDKRTTERHLNETGFAVRQKQFQRAATLVLPSF